MSLPSKCATFWLRTFLAFLLLALVNPALAMGDEAPLKKQVAELLDAGWPVGAKALAAAEEQYQAVHTAVPADVRVDRAWALVLIKQRRFDQALEQFDAILQRQPDDLGAMMWKVRIKILTKKNSAALVEMERLAQAVAKSAGDTLRLQENLVASRFLGRAFGYLAGPAELAPNVRDEAKARLIGLLDGDRRAAFEDGQKSIANQFVQYQQQREQTQVETRQKEEQDKQDRKKQIEGKQAQIDKDVAEVSAERARLREEQRHDEAALLRDVRQAESFQADAEARLSAVINQWDSLQVSRAQWAAAFDAEKDAGRRELIRNEITQIDFSLGPVEAERRRREADVLRARSRRAELARSQAELQQRYQGLYGGLDRRETASRHDQARLGGQQKKNDRPVSASSPRDRNLATRANAYTTYEDFPLEAEKAKLLGSFK